MKSGLKKLDYLVTSTTPAAVIFKAIIFDNNINIAGKIVIHLQS